MPNGIGLGCEGIMMNMPQNAEPNYAVPASLGIERVVNGYIVRVGCKTIVYEDRAIMLKELDRYLADPKKVSEEYLAKEKGAV